MRRQIARKRRVATFVLAQPHTVDPNGRRGHDTFEVDENALAARLRGQTKTTPVNGNKLILLVVEAMPRQPDIRVGNNDVIKRRVVELPRVRPFDEGPVVTPIPVDGKNHPAHCVGSRGHGIASKQSWRKGGSRNDSARCLQKISSVHSVSSSFSPHILPALRPSFDDCRTAGHGPRRVITRIARRTTLLASTLDDLKDADTIVLQVERLGSLRYLILTTDK